MDDMALPEFLFHGTSDGYLDAILHDGLRPESSGNGYLCYADDIGIAWHHASCMAEWDGGMLKRPCLPVVFAVPIAAFDHAAFVLEEAFIRNGPSAGRACTPEGASFLRDRHGRRPWTWPELLAHAGVVGYAMTLRVSPAMLLREPAPAAVARP